ncbi:MAG: adenylate/guanylate cyclase domain-containing protein [Melioribacter sp.]|nr:adenylate/guanylate cyclase domain-containing protein [Melioribacter sp.]
MNIKIKKDYVKQSVIILFASILTILFTQDYLLPITPLKEIELKLIDRRFAERGQVNLGDSSHVIILEITQDAYDQIPPPYNRWPWPRFIFAKVIENLNQAGVKAIGIDINFTSNDQFSPLNDSLMKETIKKYRNVVLSGKIDIEREKLFEEGKSYIKKLNENFDNVFFNADSSIGIVQVPADNDGVFRRYLPFVKSNVANKLVPSFGFALLNKYYNLPKFYTAKKLENYFLLADKKIPQYDKNSILINFYGPSRTFPHVKLIDVLDDKGFKTVDELEISEDINTWDNPDGGWLYSNRFKDKIVIIGSTMPEDRDILPVSFTKGKQKGDNLIYGVEFHANIVENIIRNDFLYKQSNLSELLMIIFLCFYSFLVTSVIRKLKLHIGLLLELLNVIIILLSIYLIYRVSVYYFIQHKVVTVIVSPSLAIILGYFSSTAYHFLRERQQNVLIKGMFSHYVSKAVVNELISNPEKLRLGGEKKVLTVMFSDIANFTTFAEKKQPEELVSFINQFLNEMSEIIIANDGTLDKYLGDAVMAFWGAPIEVKDHAYKACLTALQMQTRLTQLREIWTSKNEASIHIRIGINTGEVIVGNIGGKKRFDYTVLGDNVNLASRLEGANKEYGTSIMISESTYELVKDKFLVRYLDLVRVKGKTKPTAIYELISTIGDEKAEEAIETMDYYFQGIELYRHRNFEPALDYFKRSYEKLKDYPSKVYMNRCEFYLNNPPDENWDGVFELKTK